MEAKAASAAAAAVVKTPLCAVIGVEAEFLPEFTWYGSFPRPKAEASEDGDAPVRVAAGSGVTPGCGRGVDIPGRGVDRQA